MSAPAAEAPRALRRHFAAHNRRVLLLLGLSILLVALGWAICYGVVVWLILLVRTLWAPLENAALPVQLPWIFLATSLLLIAGLLLANWHRIERLPDRTRWWQHFFALVLALPAATLSLWDTFSAYQFLRQDEMQLAWQLLRRIHLERRLPFHAVPQEIPDERTRHRVLVALQITDLVRVLNVGREIRLVLANDHARQLAGPRIRFQLPGV